MNKRHSNSSNSVLVGNSFPFPIIRRAATIRLWPLRRLKNLLASRASASFWGHANTRSAGESILSGSLAPASERPALALSRPPPRTRRQNFLFLLRPLSRLPLRLPPRPGCRSPFRTNLRMAPESSLFTNESDIEDIYKPMSNLCGRMKKAGFADAESLVPQRGRAIMFPLPRIKWRNVSKLVDICGCLFKSREVYDAISYLGKDTSGCMPERRA